MDALLGVYQAVLAPCIIGLTINTLEYWSIASAFRAGGTYSWKVLRGRANAPYLDRLGSFGERAVRTLLGVRLLTLLGVAVAPIGGGPFVAALGGLILANTVFAWRRALGDDGSDRMNTIVLLTVLLCVGPHSTPFILQVGLWFIALQACLAYTTAGLAKLRSPSWRQGDALAQVFSTRTYGMEAVGQLFGRQRWLNRPLCWSVIAMETLFPLCLVIPAPWAWIFLAWGGLFHILCAVIMGFNGFLWAFLATYPAIVYVGGVLRQALGVE
jgi:hypothetical protein